MEEHVQKYGREVEFDPVPLAFETTGAMGKMTQKWWNSVLKLEKEGREQGEPTSRRMKGLEQSWSADNFQKYWLQRISMAHVMEQAESIDLWITKCTSVNY